MNLRLATLPLFALLALPAAAAAAPSEAQPWISSQVTTSASDQLDPSVASDPTALTGGLRRVVAYTDWSGVNAQTGYAYTTPNYTTNTVTWTRQTLPTLPGVAGVATRGVPSVAWSTNGSVYLAQTAVDAGGNACDPGGKGGIYLSTSADAGHTFPASVQVAANNAGSSGFTRSAPTALADRSTIAGTSGQPIVVYASRNTCAAGATTSIDIAGNGTGWVGQSLASTPGEVSAPAAVAIPGATSTIAIAYLRAFSASVAQVEVVRCTRSSNAAFFSCDPTPEVVGNPFFPAATAAGGIVVDSGPALAYSPYDGSLHVAFTVATGNGPAVLYSRSDPGTSSWSTPIDVATPAAQAHGQFRPALSVAPNGRVDVVYLDQRDDPGHIRYTLYQTSFLGGVRGQDVRLDLTTSAKPAHGVGSRIAATTLKSSLPDAISLLGHVYAYWPRSAGTADIYEGDLWHGLSHPQIGADPVGGSTVQKNTALPLPASWFAAIDPDGDPDSVAVTDPPALGTISDDDSTYFPSAQGAGLDAFTITATDTRLSASVTHQIMVVDGSPVFADGDFVRAPFEGDTVTVDLFATDPDPGDPIIYKLAAPKSLSAHASLAQIPGGRRLVVDVPNPYRATAVLRVTAVDSSGASADQDIVLAVRPHYRAPTARIIQNISGSTVGFSASVSWAADPDNACLGTGQCRLLYRWDFLDNNSSSTDSAPRHRYATIGTYTVRLRVRVQARLGLSPEKTITQRVAIAYDPRTRLSVRTRLGPRGRTLIVLLRSRDDASIGVALKGPGTNVRGPTLRVRAGRKHAFGPERAFVVRLRQAHPRLATLVISYTGAFAGQPLPDSLRRRVWLGAP